MHPIHKQFSEDSKRHIAEMNADKQLMQTNANWCAQISKYKYVYNWSWMGIPLIQYPTDIMVEQELIFSLKPDVILETGIAHGGSAIFHASMLELLSQTDGHTDRYTIAIDIDIREHNRVRIENNAMFKRIKMLEGSSVAPEIVGRVFDMVGKNKKVLLILDSLHTYEHVYKELQLYSPLVTEGMYIIVQDTIVEYMSEEAIGNRPWGKGNNPLTAVQEFLKESERFEIDDSITQKSLITCNPSGYLKCIK